jgi:hypothetical protein
VVDVRGPGLFDVTGDDVYVRYKEKSSAEQALIELVGRYDSLCLAPPSDIQADKFGYFTITFVNDKCLSKSDVWYIFSKFGTVACVNGTFDCKKGRVFVSYKEKQGALNALETMLITKEYHLQVSKNSTVRKNDYNVAVPPPGIVAGKDPVNEDFDSPSNGGLSSNSSASNLRQLQGPNAPPPNGVMANHSPEDFMHQRVQRRDQSRSREPSLVPGPHSLQSAPPPNIPPPGQGVLLQGGSQNVPPIPGTNLPPPNINNSAGGSHENSPPPPQRHQQHPAAGVPPLSVIAAVTQGIASQQPNMQHIGINNSTTSNNANTSPSSSHEKPSLVNGVPDNGSGGIRNGLVKFNRNVEKDIFGYFCLSFLNEDGDINEKKVRHDFGKFGEVVSVRGALGKQKGHVFVRFRRKEAAENCLNCLNSFPLSEMSELFGKYLFLSPATPRDIDCDMWGLYSISFLNLNMKNFKEIRSEFSKFGEIVRLQSGGGGNTDELVSISYSDKNAAVKALQTHFTNKEFPYLDIAKGSSLLLVNSSESSDSEEVDHHPVHQQYQRDMNIDLNIVGNGSGNSSPSNNRQAMVHNSGQKSSAAPPLNAAPGAPICHHNQHNHDGNGYINGHARPGHIGQNGRHGPGHPLTLQDDLFLGRNGGQNCGSDVVDELLKPLQSYFSIYRTGQYHSPTGEGLLGQLGQLGVTPGSAAAIAFAEQAAALQIGNEGHNQEQFISGLQHQQQHNQTTNTPNNSPDKKYRIKNVKIPNGVNVHVPPPNMVSAPPPPPQTSSNNSANRTPSRHQPTNFHSQKSPMSHQPQQSSPRQLMKMHHHNTKNSSNGHFVNGHQRSNSSGACVVPVSKTNDVINNSNNSSSINVNDKIDSTNGSNKLSSTFLVPGESNPTSTQVRSNVSRHEFGNNLLVNGFADHENKQGTNLDSVTKVEHQFVDNVHQQQVNVAVANNQQNDRNHERSTNTNIESTTSKSSASENLSKSSVDANTNLHESQENKYGAENTDAEGDLSSSQRSTSPIQLEKDFFGFYSLSMVNKSKDLTERKVKIDFSRQVDSSTSDGQQADANNLVARVRGQFVPGETIIISFFEKEMAESCLTIPALLAKYPTLRAAPLEEVISDKDGHYSIEFVNSGMSGIREITNEFSRHGEVVKVMAGGAKNNAVKRVTISYSDKDAAFAAVNAAHSKHRNKDFQSVDFAKECLVQVGRKPSLSNFSSNSND